MHAKAETETEARNERRKVKVIMKACLRKVVKEKENDDRREK